jgi:leucyl aminopeptidase (aminopeptidase T)
MKKTSPLPWIFLLALFCGSSFFAAPVRAQAPNFADLAHNIITTSVAVKPGEVVVITGGKHTIPLMEALAIEAQKAGGLVTIFLDSDKVIRSRNADVDEKFLGQEPRFFGEWLKQVDVWISLPNASDIKALDAGVSAQRLATIAKAGDFLIPMLDGTKVRGVSLIYPTEERGKSFGLDGATYVNMIWQAMGADYKQIAAQGDALRKMLQTAKSVHVTSPSGTDLRFSVGNRPVFVDDGTLPPDKARSKRFLDRNVGLPSGSLFFAPVETSATGKVVVPRAECRYEAINDISFTFRNGRMENFKAGQNANCFTELKSASRGATDQFGGIGIGLNPAWPIHEENGAAYYPSTAGLVFVSIGDNQILGGSNKAEGTFGFSFPIVGATVEIDGKVVIKDGRIVL